MIALMGSVVSCDKLNDANTSVDGFTTLKISASVPQTDMTKTYFNNGNVWWVKDDVLTVLANGASAKSNAPTKAVETFDFQVTEWPENIEPQYAVFNGPGGNSYDDFKPSLDKNGYITATLRSNQMLYHKNNMSKVANMSVGELVKSESGYSTVMHNVCGLIKFTLTKEAKKVLIEEVSNPDEPKYLTGKVKLQMKDGKPEVASIVNGNSKVVLEMSNNELLQPAYYYACVLPGEYKLKFTLLDEEDNTIRELTANSLVNIERSKIVDFGNLNNAVSPTNSIEIVLDFSAQPFDPAITGTNTKTKETYKLLNTNYNFTLYNKTHGFTYSASGKYLRLIGDTGTAENPNPGCGYIQLPGVPEYRLLSATITGANGSGTKTYYISDIDPIENTITDDNKLGKAAIKAKETGTIQLSDSEFGVGYYLMLEGTVSDKNAQFSKIVLKYIK